MSQDDSSRTISRAFDPVVQQIAKVYAHALLGAAQSGNQTEAIVEEFDSLVSDVFDPHPELERLLSSGILTHDEKVGILDRTLGGQASPLLLNFLKVLSAHGRLDGLRAIHQSLHDAYDVLCGRVRVEVRTAVPLDSQLAERLTSRLREMFDGEPQLNPTTHPDLIGGIVLKVGDTVLDGSVASQLAQVRHQMIDRSVHEIQSRRDHFRITT